MRLIEILYCIIKPRKMIDIRRVLSTDYWLELSEKTSVDPDSKSKCYDWVRDAQRILSDNGYGGIFKEVEVGEYEREGGLLYRKQDSGITLWKHWWLEHNHNGRRFIADGTAGEIDPAYLNGFYGYIDEAPENLRRIYCYKNIPPDQSALQSSTVELMSELPKITPSNFHKLKKLF